MESAKRRMKLLVVLLVGMTFDVSWAQDAKDGPGAISVTVNADVELSDSQTWFGVELAVPDAIVSKQLGLDGRGLVVTNICKSCPSEQAGLERYDIIVQFAGQGLKNDIASFRRTIQSLNNQSEVDLVVLRDAAELPMRVMLTTRPQGQGLQWLYQDKPDTVFHANVAFGGKVLHLSPEGETYEYDLGHPDDMPHQLLALLPKWQGISAEAWVSSDGQIASKCQVTKNDSKFEFEQPGNGQIVVRRMRIDDEDGEDVEEHVYAAEMVFKDEDPDTYALFVEAKPENRFDFATIELSVPSDAYDRARAQASNSHFLSRDVDLVKEWSVKHREHAKRLQEWHDIWSRAMNNVDDELTEQLLEYEHAYQTIRELTKSLQERLGERLAYLESEAHEPPRFRFTEDVDGHITVTIRNGDSELVRTYRSLDHLAEQNPAHFERVRALMTSE